MTNTELIRQEIERRIGAMYNFSSGYSALNTCRELLDFIDKLPKETVTNCHQLDEAARTSWFNYEFDCGALYSKCYKDGFKAGAKWQREQDHNACYQCEKAYDNVFFRGEQHAIKMLKEEAIGGTVCGRVIDHINIRFADGVGKYLEPKDISHIPADKSKYNIGDKVKVIILKDE